MARKSAQVNKQLVLTGVMIRAASVHNSDERHVRVEFSAAWTTEIRKEMDWSDLEDNQGAMDLLPARIPLSNAILIPDAPVAKNGDMPQHQEEFSATEISGFSVLPIKDKGGEIQGRELRFTIKSGHMNTAGKIARYVSKLGRAPANLTLTLADEEEEQLELEKD